MTLHGVPNQRSFVDIFGVLSFSNVWNVFSKAFVKFQIYSNYDETFTHPEGFTTEAVAMKVFNLRIKLYVDSIWDLINFARVSVWLLIRCAVQELSGRRIITLPWHCPLSSWILTIAANIKFAQKLKHEECLFEGILGFAEELAWILSQIFMNVLLAERFRLKNLKRL